MKQQSKPGEQKVSGRADLGDNDIGPNGVFQGQTIVIPTKGCMCELLIILRISLYNCFLYFYSFGTCNKMSTACIRN